LEETKDGPPASQGELEESHDDKEAGQVTWHQEKGMLETAEVFKEPEGEKEKQADFSLLPLNCP
jgi:hypothetical protein